MNPLSYKLKLALDAGIIALVIFCTWYITSDHYQKKIAEIQLGMTKAVQTQLLANQAAADQQAAKIKSAEEQHAKDQLNNTRLRNELARVQIHGICSSPVPGNPQARPDTNPAPGILSDRVDAAFADLQNAIGQLLERCDELNIDARLFNASQ